MQISPIKKQAFLFINLIFLALAVLGQNSVLKFKQITVEDGLSQSWVRCILQDKYDYIWLGTDNGLNRYNGYEITTFKNKLRNKNALSDNSILTMYEDSRGNLWIGTAAGINRYNRNRNVFDRDSLLATEGILSITEDGDKNLIVGTYSGLFKYNFAKNQFENYSFKAGNIDTTYRAYLRNAHFLSIFTDKNKNIWFGSNMGLGLFERSSNKFYIFSHQVNNLSSLGNNHVKFIYQDNSGRIWIGHNEGLDLLADAKNFSNASFEHFTHDKKNPESISLGMVTSILEYNGELWVGVDNGGLNILKLNSGKKIKNKFVRHWSSPNGLSNHSIYSLYKDKQKNMWVGTFGNGVNLHSPQSYNFSMFKSDPGNEFSLSSNQINAFLEDGDYLWVGTERGLNRYDKKTNTFKSYTHNPNDNSTIGSNAVWALYKDKKGNFWVGTWAGGLNKFYSETGKFTHYYYNASDPKSIGSNNIFSIFEDSDNNLWIGTMGGGLNMLDRKTNTFIRYNQSNSSIPFNYVESITEDVNGDLWMSNLVLTRFNRKTKTFRSYRNTEADSGSISSSKVYAVFCDSKSNIWIGTDAGLNLYQPQGDNFKSFQTYNGLPDDAVKSITEDNSENLWLGTNKGLCQIIGAINLPEVPKFKKYTKEDGVVNNEFNRRSCLRGHDEFLYFGGENGFVRFNPKTLTSNAHIPKIVFTDFLLFNTPVKTDSKNSPLTKDISETKSITLKHYQSVYTIKFVALNYMVPEKNQYAYIMEGFDKTWNYVGNKREATYTNLDAGTYTFRVKASNNDGVWNQKGTSIEIIILPPWYKTWWFKLLIISLLGGCLVYILFRIINKIKHLANQTILDERNQLKTLINNIPDQVFIKDRKSRFIVVNNKTVEQLGKKHEKDILNKTDYDFFAKEEAAIFMQQEKEIMRTGTPLINIENKRVVNDNEEYFLQTKCSIINSKGETIGLLGIVKNITTQKKAEDELKKYYILLEERNRRIEEQAEELKSQTEILTESNILLLEKQQLIQKQASELTESNKQLSTLNATKDKLFSIIAHDLRNPFSTVIGFSDILIQNFRKYPVVKIEKFLNFIYTSSVHGNDLLSNLLMWSRAQNGTISFNPETQEISEIIKETLNLLEGSAQKKNIILLEGIEKDLYCAFDENMIKTVIRNLVSNAIKFTPENGKIIIRTERKDKDILVSVADTGVGISKANQEKLFHVNSNITTKGTANETGTGLGLVLCKEFVEKHGGKIWVESEEGKGSDFRFSLPLNL